MGFRYIQQGASLFVTRLSLDRQTVASLSLSMRAQCSQACWRVAGLGLVCVDLGAPTDPRQNDGLNLVFYDKGIVKKC